MLTKQKTTGGDIKKIVFADKAKASEYKKYKEFKEKETRDFLENLTVNNKNMVCRDASYDDIDNGAVLFILKAFVIGALPILMGIFLSCLVSKSADFRIQPATWQAYASLMLLVAASVGMVLSIKLYSKRNNVGNKFLYYVISENGLYFTHLGYDEIGRFIRAHMKTTEKIKTVPLWIYVLIFMIAGNGRSRAKWLARVEMAFKINQKYRIAEKLLGSDLFESYCCKVVGVTKIKEYSYGCEITWKYLRNGVAGEENRIIYKNTDNYDLLTHEFNKRLVGETVGDTPSIEERKQIYANIIRITLTLLFVALIIIIISISAYGMYLKNTAAAENFSDGMMKAARYILARRAEKRSARGVYGIAVFVLIPIIKMIIDMANSRAFTVVPVKVKNYYKPKRPFYYEVLSEFHYFANVEWKGENVSVGLSRSMWKQKDNVTPLLVIRKGIPYCLIYRKL